MTDPSLIADLIRAGLDPDLVARVSNALLAEANSTGIPPDRTAEKRRAWDRERKRHSTGIPPDSTGNASAVYNREVSKLESKKERKKDIISRASRIPPDWTPDIEAARAEGLSESDAAREGARFRDFWTAKSGKDATKLDWMATWRNWCRNAADRLGRKPAATAVYTEPIWKKPPPEYLARIQQEKANGTQVGTEARSGAHVVENGADKSGEFRVSGGGVLRPEVGGAERGPPDNPQGNA